METWQRGGALSLSIGSRDIQMQQTFLTLLLSVTRIPPPKKKSARKECVLSMHAIMKWLESLSPPSMKCENEPSPLASLLKGTELQTKSGVLGSTQKQWDGDSAFFWGSQSLGWPLLQIFSAYQKMWGKEVGACPERKPLPTHCSALEGCLTWILGLRRWLVVWFAACCGLSKTIRASPRATGSTLPSSGNDIIGSHLILEWKLPV